MTFMGDMLGKGKMKKRVRMIEMCSCQKRNNIFVNEPSIYFASSLKWQ
jgi:hypothetical protein